MAFKKRLLYIILTVFMLLTFLTPVKADGGQSFPEVWTDEPDYAPGETVLIIGSGFIPDSQVTVDVTKPGSSVDTLYADTNEAGNFSCYYGPVSTEGEYNVKVTDGVNVAETTFTDCWVLIRMYYSEDHEPFVDGEVDRRGYCYVFNPGKNMYITFRWLKLNTDYRVEFWAYQDGQYKEVTSMTHEFNSDGSERYDHTAHIPSDAPLSTDGKPWKIKLYKLTDGECLVSCRRFWVAEAITYEDSEHKKPEDHFLPGETVYIKGEGFKPCKWVKISYYYEGESGLVKMYGPYYVGPTQRDGSFTAEFTCTPPVGKWIILARWSGWCWCPSSYYKTVSFFVVPELTFGTLSAFLIASLSLAFYKKISHNR